MHRNKVYCSFIRSLTSLETSKIHCRRRLWTGLPKNVRWMYSEIWLPDLLDSARWLSSRFNSRLNCHQHTHNYATYRCRWQLHSNVHLLPTMLYIHWCTQCSTASMYRAPEDGSRSWSVFFYFSIIRHIGLSVKMTWINEFNIFNTGTSEERKHFLTHNFTHFYSK